jgi:hypothetical protein
MHLGKPRAYPVSLASGKPHLVRLFLFGFGLSELGKYETSIILSIHIRGNLGTICRQRIEL